MIRWIVLIIRSDSLIWIPFRWIVLLIRSDSLICGLGLYQRRFPFGLDPLTDLAAGQAGCPLVF